MFKQQKIQALFLLSIVLASTPLLAPRESRKESAVAGAATTSSDNGRDNVQPSPAQKALRARFAKIDKQRVGNNKSKQNPVAGTSTLQKTKTEDVETAEKDADKEVFKNVTLACERPVESTRMSSKITQSEDSSSSLDLEKQATEKAQKEAEEEELRQERLEQRTREIKEAKEKELALSGGNDLLKAARQARTLEAEVQAQQAQQRAKLEAEEREKQTIEMLVKLQGQFQELAETISTRENQSFARLLVQCNKECEDVKTKSRKRQKTAEKAKLEKTDNAAKAKALLEIEDAEAVARPAVVTEEVAKFAELLQLAAKEAAEQAAQLAQQQAKTNALCRVDVTETAAGIKQEEDDQFKQLLQLAAKDRQQALAKEQERLAQQAAKKAQADNSGISGIWYFVIGAGVIILVVKGGLLTVVYRNFKRQPKGQKKSFGTVYKSTCKGLYAAGSAKAKQLVNACTTKMRAIKQKAATKLSPTKQAIKSMGVKRQPVKVLRVGRGG